MLRNFLRQFSILFSIFYFKKIKINFKKHLKIEKFIKKKSNEIYKKNPRLNTHKNLAGEIIRIIKLGNLNKFLRNSFIQKIFFIHNRLFIFFELLELKKDKNWTTWKKLILENDVGRPVRFFLYSNSSGNRIRQVYIIKKFLNSLKSINLDKIQNIIEVGGGYGCMADIFSKLNKKISYTIYDMYEVNLLQYYFLKMNNHNPLLGKISGKLNLISELNQLNKFTITKKNYCFIANWSISEFPLKFRKKFINTINRSNYSIISFQENFENINNLKFFNKIFNKMRNKFIINLQTFDHYNNSPLNKNNHYILTLVRK
tara:strand:+ start:314 stop:1258 length:945 start_codon:yes stop_codon:yes gene_type:complete